MTSVALYVALLTKLFRFERCSLSYRSKHWIDFGSMEGRFVSDVYFLRLLPFAFEFAPSGAPFTGFLRCTLARPFGTAVGAKGRGALKQSLMSFFRRSTQLVTGGSWTGNRFKQLQRYKNKSCTSSGLELDAKIGWVVAIASFTPLLKIRKMFGRNDPGVLFGKLLEHLPDAPPVPFVEVRNVLVLHEEY